MELPVELRLAVEERVSGVAVKALSGSAERISERYRTESGRGRRLVQSAQEALAYAAARMPATYGAAGTVLAELSDLMPEGERIASMLDVGAGTGTASWAASGLFAMDRITCLEREGMMRTLGCELSRASDDPALHDSEWAAFDVTADPLERHADLVVASYMLNELTEEHRLPALMKLWSAADKYLVVIEPGTPEGFRQILAERAALLAAGAHVAAPCAHGDACPVPAGDWCHFACRVSRSRLQKTLKGGDAPFEDEKFSYMIFAREPVPARLRVLRHPAVEPGRITLTLCTPAGREVRPIPRKDPVFKRARKVKWGDAWTGEGD